MNRLIAVLAGLALVWGQSTVQADEPAKAKGYALHEWGVFTSHHDAERLLATWRTAH